MTRCPECGSSLVLEREQQAGRCVLCESLWQRAAAAEREACAQLAGKMTRVLSVPYPERPGIDEWRLEPVLRDEIAAAIRARGER